MFKVEFFIDDNRLGSVLRTLAGSGAKDVRQVPVTNIEPAPRDGVRARDPAGNQQDLLVAHMRRKRLTRIKYTEIMAWLKELGRSPNSAGYLTARLRKDGILTLKGESGARYYEVKLPKAEK